jgi:hypothetical protein
MIPTVSSSGLLTVTSTTFWRPGVEDFPVAGIDEGGNPFVTGIGTMADVNPTPSGFAQKIVDTSDVRFTQVVQTHTIQLTGAGLYEISAGSCCRVSGIENAVEGNWTMNSSIYWDGSTANTPIQFTFGAIQPEVDRGEDYTGNLGATAGAGLNLTYDQALNTDIVSQPPGLSIDNNTGDLFISGANTNTYTDNPFNEGADYAFSGNIYARNASGDLRGSVEFDWLFDAVDESTVNRAPDVIDDVITVIRGTTVNHTFIGSDPDGDPLTWSFLALLGPSIGIAPTFDPSTQLFAWDTTGSALGTFVAQVRASDGFLTDVGQLTINVIDPNGQIPEPASMALVGGGLALAVAMRRRLRQA